MFKSWSRTFAVVVIGILGMLAVACSSSSDPSLASVADPMPPIKLHQQSLGGEIIDQLPQLERQCLNRELGDDAYKEFRSRGFTLLTPKEGVAFFRCISQDSAARLYIALSWAASIVGGASEEMISNETYDCMRGVLDEYDVRGVVSGEIQQELEMLVGTLLCLNDKEAVQAKVDAFPAAATLTGELSLVEMRCVAEQTGVSDMIRVLMEAPGEGGLPQALLAVTEGCGIEFTANWTSNRSESELIPYLPSLTGEQFQCLSGSMESQALIELQSQTRSPSNDELAILMACGVQMELR